MPAVFVAAMEWDQKTAGFKAFMQCEVQIQHWTGDVALCRIRPPKAVVKITIYGK